MPKGTGRTRRSRTGDVDYLLGRGPVGEEPIVFTMKLHNGRDYPTLVQDLTAWAEFAKRETGRKRMEIIRRLLYDRLRQLKEAGEGPFRAQKSPSGAGVP